MTARRHLNEQQFSQIRYEDSLNRGDIHSIYAFHPSFGNGELPIGSFHWFHQAGQKWGKPTVKGQIDAVEVQPEFQKNGVARAMYERATGIGPQPLHAPDRTKEGKAWSRKIGGPSAPGVRL